MDLHLYINSLIFLKNYNNIKKNKIKRLKIKKISKIQNQYGKKSLPIKAKKNSLKQNYYLSLLRSFFILVVEISIVLGK
jgi:hypothetical protein